MSDFIYHGSYPFDSELNHGCEWHEICRFGAEVAFTFYTGLLLHRRLPIEGVEFRQYLNKAFTVVQYNSDEVFAIYKHDAKWWLIKADLLDFLKAWEKSGRPGQPTDCPRYT